MANDLRSSRDDVLWTPKNAANAALDTYRRNVNKHFQLNLQDSHDLQRWSVQRPHDFWPHLYTFLDLQPPLAADIRLAFDDSLGMSANPPFFPGHCLNYAENALFANPNPDAVALVGLRESIDGVGDSPEELVTWADFRDRVRRAASALRACGVKQGDRVAALVATSVEVMVLFHAAASIAAIFTCVSPELGLEGCVTRFQQVTPAILFAHGDTTWKGKTASTADKLQQIVESLSPRPQVYVVPIVTENTMFPTFDQFMAKANPSDDLTFARVPFNYPLMICYSSGTTGAPKCMVHQHGIILQVKKISVVHNSTTPADVILQYSSTSWVVFYVMCGYFACGAKTIVYNGSPMHPDANQLLRLVERYRVTYFGTSPRYLLELEQAHTIPKQTYNLESLRIVYTTGAHLSPEQYRWFYRSFPPHIHLCNTAGGTDTATSLIAADPCSPIHAGEMQILALGMDVDILDPNTGESIFHTGQAGEMVIRTAFPSMPCFFWGDDSRNTKFRETYFSRFAEQGLDVWAQSDWLSRNPTTGGFVMHGRSDGVLNPSGVRFGSGEIYAIVEGPRFNRVISNSLCVGRRRPGDRDEDVFLFLVMREGEKYTVELANDVKRAVREGLSARHVPRFVLEVPAIPVTINGKKIEAAVKQTLSGKKVTPSNTVQNPDSIAYFQRFVDLEREPREAKL